MDPFGLILAVSEPSWLTWSWHLLQVCIGLSMVIFVHELGHFAVAKACGVKCEKFYIGFDFWNLRFFRFQWGETEYGIGIFPLGGYVKMLGQDDNPNRLAEETARARAGGDADAASVGGEEKGEVSAADDSGTSSEAADVDESVAKDATNNDEEFDPRSYLAKSVPQRMAIISAGVIMNVIFAFVLAMVAYRMGVAHEDCAVGAVFPGDAAWQAGIQPDDRIERINGDEVKRFRDLLHNVSLGDIQQGVSLSVRRPGVEELIELSFVPDQKRLAPTIGVTNGWTTDVVAHYPGTPGGEAMKQFPGGARIVQIDGEPIANQAELQAAFAAHPDRAMKITFQPPANAEDQADSSEDAKAASPALPKPITLEVAARKMRRLGLVMEMGPIVAIQAGSPAARAGLVSGDVIEKLNGDPVGDPMTLPDRLRQLSLVNPEATLTVRRAVASESSGNPSVKPQSIEVPVRLRVPRWQTSHSLPDAPPMPAAALGAAYRIERRIVAVLPNSPAADAGIKPRQLVETVMLLPPEEIPPEYADFVPKKQKVISLADDSIQWPFVEGYLVQDSLPGSKFKLTLVEKQETNAEAEPIEVTLTPMSVDNWYHPNRGFLFAPQQTVVQAETASETVQLGAEETGVALTMVYRTIKKLGSRQVSPKALGGPVMIFQVATSMASEGTAKLLIFLVILSANLAVINLIPIPVLDGGHLVFLLYEGVTGKRPNENVQAVLTYVGLLMVLALMIFVFGLDIGRLFGWS